MVPINLITGTLGSGKTTLLRRIVQEAKPGLAILMNEFGDIGIDGQVVKGKNIDMVELAGGCVCCELTGEFEAAVRELIDNAAPKRIVMEATGVAESDALTYEIEESLPEVRLDSVICIVDAYAYSRFPEIGYVGRTQLEAADIILLNKIDLVSANEISDLKLKVESYNETAWLFESVRCDINIGILLSRKLHNKPSYPTSATINHDLQSFSYKSEKGLGLGCFTELTKNLSVSVLRAKGFLVLSGKGYLYNYVSGNSELEEYNTKETKIVFIGKGLGSEKKLIINALENCRE
jgi:G3E family GTPase